MTANIQNAKLFTKNRKCVICKERRIANKNKSGCCEHCWRWHTTEVNKHVEFKRAEAAGQDTLIYPTRDTLDE